MAFTEYVEFSETWIQGIFGHILFGHLLKNPYAVLGDEQR